MERAVPALLRYCQCRAPAVSPCGRYAAAMHFPWQAGRSGLSHRCLSTPRRWWSRCQRRLQGPHPVQSF